jgi:hypothetical protein
MYNAKGQKLNLIYETTVVEAYDSTSVLKALSNYSHFEKNDRKDILAFIKATLDNWKPGDPKPFKTITKYINTTLYGQVLLEHFDFEQVLINCMSYAKVRPMNIRIFETPNMIWNNVYGDQGSCFFKEGATGHLIDRATLDANNGKAWLIYDDDQPLGRVLCLDTKSYTVLFNMYGISYAEFRHIFKYMYPIQIALCSYSNLVFVNGSDGFIINLKESSAYNPSINLDESLLKKPHCPDCNCILSRSNILMNEDKSWTCVSCDAKASANYYQFDFEEGEDMPF